MLRMIALVLAVGLAAPLTAATLDGPYDLLFKEGTLDGMSGDPVLTYTRDVTNTAKPEAAERDTGLIALGLEDGDVPLVSLRFEQDGKHRGLGTFPASVGNPMIMYFYESVVRDMAETAGGSPFYIRNRVKEALVKPAEITSGEAEFEGKTVETQTVTLHPFAGDPNSEQMQGFGELELRVTMSEAVPGWYLTLVAEAPVYRSELRLGGAAE